jgi:hypothetical protein
MYCKEVMVCNLNSGIAAIVNSQFPQSPKPNIPLAKRIELPLQMQ